MQKVVLMSDIEETIKEYGYIRFNTVTEEWSEYKLSDGTIIKIKVIPLKFLKRDKNYPLNSIVLMIPFSPPELRGEQSTTPLPTTDTAMKEALNEIDMKFDALNEPWNEYELDDGIKLSIKTVATSISSTKLYDPAGEPVYFVSHQVLTKRYPPI
jgi:hypothetical protein